MVALSRSMTRANASGKVVVVSSEWYKFMSLCNLAFGIIVEMRRPAGAWSSTESRELWCKVISNAPVGTASRSRLIG